MAVRLVLVLIILFEGTQCELNYECDPYGTLFVTNPDPDVFRYVHAVDYWLLGDDTYNDTDFVCRTYMLGITHPKIIIEPWENGYCGMDRPVLLTLSNTSLHETIKISVPYQEKYMIRCTNIPHTGMTVNITQEFLGEDRVDDAPVDYDLEDIGRYPTLDLSVRSSIYPCCDLMEYPPHQVSAMIGTYLLWTLDVYNEYYILPLLCRAHAGKTPTGQPSAVLLEDGCSMNERLLTYRTTVDNWTIRRRRVYVMNLFAFHFYKTPYVTIVCHIRVCPKSAPENCEWTCPKDERRRKSTGERFFRLGDEDIATTVTTMYVEGTLNAGCSSDFDICQVISVLSLVIVSILTDLLILV